MAKKTTYELNEEVVATAAENDAATGQDNAQTEGQNEREMTEKEKIAENERYLREMVTIRLFLDNDKYKDDLVVVHNGKAWQIQRGVDVKVPRYIAEIIRQSQEQDSNTAKLIQANVNRYMEKSSDM